MQAIKSKKPVNHGGKASNPSTPLKSSSSPYRIGNWTVTMLKDELRVRRLPTSGTKIDLIDRLENSESPIKTPIRRAQMIDREIEASTSKLSPRALVEGLQARFLKNKLSQDHASPLKDARGRSRARSPAESHRMLTRSVSSSMIQGTYLTWRHVPLQILGNFLLSGFDFVHWLVSSKPLTLLAGLVVVAAFIGGYSFSDSMKTFSNSILFNLQDPTKVAFEGFLFSVGLGEDNFGKFFSSVSKFMMSCRTGNAERTSSGLLRCVHPKLSENVWSQAARLLSLTAPELFFWTLGSMLASLLLYKATHSTRTNWPLLTNRQFIQSVALFNRNFAITSLISSVLGLDISALTAGFSGLSFGSYAKSMLLHKGLVGTLIMAAMRIFLIKSNAMNWLLQNYPQLQSLTGFGSQINVSLVRSAVSTIVLATLASSLIKLIANSRTYKKSRLNRNRN